MKKLNKLFAILFAVLGVTTLKAQTDVTSTYLTNADFSSKDGWTQYISGSYRDIGSGNIGGKLASYAASSTDATHLNSEYFFGFQCRWNGNYSSYNQETSQALPSGVYTLSYDVENVNGGTSAVNYNNLFYVKVGDKTFTDTSVEWMKGKSSWTSHSITFVITEATKATVSLGYGTGSNNLGTGNTPVLYVSHLKLIHRELDDISSENPADLTSYIVNNSFETGNLNGWTYKGSSDTGVKPNSNGTYTTSGVDGNYLFNTWWQGTPLTQTVGNIPNGIYELKVLLASDQNAKLFLLANDEHSEVYTITTDNKTFHDVSYEFKVLNGQAKIGVVGGNDAGEYVAAGHWWYKADNFRLIYKGADLSIEKEALEANIATARAIDQTTIPTAIATQLNAAITAAENVEQTLNAIKAATNELIEIINLANELKEPYGDAKTLIAECEAMLTNSTASDTDKATYQSAIDKAKEDLENANAKAAIDDIMATLRDAQKAYCLVAAPAEGHPFDLTWLVVNPKFDEGTKGWTSNTNSWSNTIATNQGGAITGNYYENWNESSYTGEIYQQLENLPKGKYVLTAAAFRDQLTGGAAEGDAVYVFANDQATLVTSATPEFYSVEVSTTTGTLKFGVKSVAKVYKWMGIDNVTLKYVAGLDLSEFTAAYTAALEAAKAARDNAEYSNVSGAERTALLTAIAATPEQSQEALSNARDALVAATATFTAAKGDYDKLVEEKEIAAGLGMSNDLINPDAANTKTGLQALQDLKVAEYTYIYSTYTESATLGSWTENFAEDLSNEGYNTNGSTYFNEWGNATRTAKQTVKLPAGDYAISSIGRGQVGTSGYLYYKIDETTNKVDFIMKGNRGLGVDVNGVANFSGEGEYNCNGEGFGWEYRFITFHLDAETEVEIGVSATFANAWVSIYAPVLLTTEASVKALRMTEIANLLSTVPTGKMNATVQATLTEKKDAAEAASAEDNTIDELETITTELKDAIDAAKTSIAEYKKILGYINMTKVFTDVTTYETKYNNGEYTTEDVEPVRQELNILRFNAASALFTNKVDVTGWTGTMGEMSNEHWSGTTVSYKDANSWNDVDPDALTTQITLPKGNYVLKVAGRCSPENATLTLKVLDQTITFHGKGATGKGIDTSGAANFSDGTYANNNNGFGWEWEFLRFSLDAEQTVTLEVNSSYNNTRYVWNSFGDITLWMDDATYVTVYGKELDAPLAEAKTLVNTLPMGETENTALINAIAQGEGTIETPDHLNAAVNALKEAVANAKTWVSDYNEAKAPLVTAFERFESDYNDGANGCLLPITDEAWQELLEAVKSAALAKDAYNDYSGFEQAAKNFNEAMDNATYKGFSMSNQLECTNIILNADCQANDAWAGNGRSVLTGQHWSGDASRVYFAQNHENGAARNQTVTMPYKGWYILKVSVRAVVANSYVDIQIDGASNKLQGAHGREGGTIATDGTEWENIAAGIAAGKNFANDNKGYGWIYKYIAFNVENANTEVKIGIALSNKDQNSKEANVGGMELYYVGSNAYVMAGNVVKHYGEYTETIATTHTTHDVTNATMSDPDVNVTANPNALIIANKGQVSNENNVVVDGTASSLVLTEGYTFNATTDFTATALNYDRKFSANWLTVCLPFAYDIPENVKVETLSAVDLDTKTFTFEEVNEKMEANKPYIIKNSSETAALFVELGDVAVEATPEAMTVEVTAEGSEHKAEFIGTYTAVKTDALMEITEDVAKYDILFFGNDGQLYYLSNGVTTKVVNIKPFRAYIRLPKGAINWSDGQQAIARHGKRTTSIDNAELATDNAPVIYDLMGRKVIQMQKGHMYIVNGKKVVIK